MSYAIRMYKNTKNGLVTRDNEVVVAGNSFFNSVSEAVNFAKVNKVVENRSALGSDGCPHIVGPKGGVYSIFTGRLLR